MFFEGLWILGIAPASGLYYCVNIMSQIQSTLPLNLCEAFIRKQSASATDTESPGGSFEPRVCVHMRVGAVVLRYI